MAVMSERGLMVIAASLAAGRRPIRAAGVWSSDNPTSARRAFAVGWREGSARRPHRRGCGLGARRRPRLRCEHDGQPRSPAMRRSVRIAPCLVTESTVPAGRRRRASPAGSRALVRVRREAALRGRGHRAACRRSRPARPSRRTAPNHAGSASRPASRSGSTTFSSTVSIGRSSKEAGTNATSVGGIWVGSECASAKGVLLPTDARPGVFHAHRPQGGSDVVLSAESRLSPRAGGCARRRGAAARRARRRCRSGARPAAGASAGAGSATRRCRGRSPAGRPRSGPRRGCR